MWGLENGNRDTRTNDLLSALLPRLFRAWPYVIFLRNRKRRNETMPEVREFKCKRESLKMPDQIKAKDKFFGLKVYIESSGIKEVDEALKTLFHDSNRRTAPLYMYREDVQLVLAWSRGEVEKKPETQPLLFEVTK